MVDKKSGAAAPHGEAQTPSAAPQRKRLLAGMAAALLIAALAFTGCAQQEEAGSGAASSEAAQSSQAQASSSAQQAAQEINATVVVMDPDNADVEAQNIPVTLQEDATVYDALEATGLDTKIEDGAYGMYMTELDGTAAEGSSGWVYTVNGEEVMESIDACRLADGDTVEFTYITM